MGDKGKKDKGKKEQQKKAPYGAKTPLSRNVSNFVDMIAPAEIHLSLALASRFT